MKIKDLFEVGKIQQKTVKEISDRSRIIESRITKEKNSTFQKQVDAMPCAPITLLNKGPRPR